jgi:hypothetical protein
MPSDAVWQLQFRPKILDMKELNRTQQAWDISPQDLIDRMLGGMLECMSEVCLEMPWGGSLEVKYWNVGVG